MRANEAWIQKQGKRLTLAESKESIPTTGRAFFLVTMKIGDGVD